ncbi:MULTISPECIES: DNA cytosine methyltransferase [unclassified Clostridium]|uniref:DNA cytosine methyltransferase n=1 Tax=unclassified Clostridium TaxID=2614128 RepID=UPI00110732C0|nr:MULTISPECIES: DNA cytosine methyltransferase [unclassified Clostridium]
MDVRAISLFSGAMGLDLGLLQAGIDIQIGQDFDNACIQTMLANGHRGIAGDIRNISADDILQQVDMKIGEPFLVCGGPPCQPFSTAGKRLGINDPRGSLFKEFVRMIDYMRPRFFVMENVKGLMSSKLKDMEGNNTDTKVLDIILEEFQKLNYKTVFGVLDAVNYGTPQFRERFVMIGSRDNEDIFLPVPTHFQVHQNFNYRWVTLGNAIQDLEKESGECATFTESRLRFLRLVPEGGNWKDLPTDILQEAMGGAYLSGGGKAGFYRRLSYSQPSPTVVTSPVQKATMMCHPKMDRPLSVAEYARIQQFPDDWIFMGTTSDKYRQIGNAVPVGLARAIGEVLVAVARGEQKIVVKRIRGTGVHEKIQNAIRIGGTSAC